MDAGMWGGLFALLIAALGCWAVIATQHIHGALTRDGVTGGPQKFAPRAVPRVGGVALFPAVLAGGVALTVFDSPAAETVFLLLVAGLPAFVAGLLEDVTKRVSVSLRLRFTFLSAAIAFFVLDARIAAVDVAYVDLILTTFVGSFLFTLFAVGGLAHAMNIIDGFNGLFAVCSVLVLAAIAVIAFQVSDQAIFAAALVVAGALLGFLLFNYPKGHIFAGDGGAYFIGFVIAQLVLLLIHRNSEVSPWFALMLLAYPVFETAFSMYRKRLVRGQSVGDPDGSHLHMLIHRRVVRWYPGSKSIEHKLTRNALTSPYLWLLCGLGVGGAVVFWDDTAAMQAMLAVFALAYVWFYRRIVYFRVPRMFMLKSGAVPPEAAGTTYGRTEEQPADR